MRLWRATREDQPFFGYRSYWTPSQDFARWFAGWLSSQAPILGDHRYVVYNADVEVHNLIDLRPRLISSEVVTSRARDLANLGYEWVSFYEGFYEGRMVAQYMYLGADSVPATIPR